VDQVQGQHTLDHHPPQAWPYAAVAAGILALHALLLHLMGRIPWCKCGFALWTSHAWSSDTSQDLADPYSFTHIIHGIVFYWLLYVAAKKLSVSQRFIVAMLVEVGWELLENSPPVIRHYRAATASLDYTGDSILNSVGDVLSCLLGFWLASWLPAKASVLLVILIELVLLATIRDNLTLNVLMLLHPFPALKQWQLGH
jgi:hypothetical protein